MAILKIVDMFLQSVTGQGIHDKRRALDRHALFFYPETRHGNRVPLDIGDVGKLLGKSDIVYPEFIIDFSSI